MKTPAFDRLLMRISPGWALARIRSRMHAEIVTRHYEAASTGRRTAGWNRSAADANVAAGSSLSALRAHSRDLRRNNPWARAGIRIISNNTVGWGIMPKAIGGPRDLMAAWKGWAETTQCDADGRLTFYGIQRQIMETVAEAGEAIIRRRPRLASDGLAIPLQLQILEPDFLDTGKDAETGVAGGPIIQGVEFDKLGRRVAYWLFPTHPGSSFATGSSRRYPASEILHIYRQERPGQVRGVPWLAPAISRLRDFDQYEDATILRNQVASLFAAFVTDPQGDSTSAALGEQSTDAAGQPVEALEPGMVKYLTPGQTVEFGNPPIANDGGFTDRVLRSVAAALGVTFEELTGDWSNVNYSSGRLGMNAHRQNVEDWRWNMLIPQFCAPAWGWAMEAAGLAGLLGGEGVVPPAPAATWTPPARPMQDPDKEGTAYKRLVRTGAMTPSEMVREQGKDPEAHWRELAEDMRTFDRLGLQLDCDPRRMSDAGLTQARAGAGGAKPGEAPVSKIDAEDDEAGGGDEAGADADA